MLLLRSEDARGSGFVWVRAAGDGLGVVTSVPTPDSPLRFGDLVGHRHERVEVLRRHGVVVSGRRQTDRVERSGIATWGVTVLGASETDLDHLGDLALARGLGADVWDETEAIRDAHAPTPGARIPAGRPTQAGVTLGLAGSRQDVEALMSDVEHDRRYITFVDLREMLTEAGEV
ncbi:hypothetical protein [Phycicoccus avicenniae]|uniref:hypothetical protein n=1 Tax=Phycicoccus avicenniae TaxID=2828860 RepID=UPI003D2CF387